MWPWFFGCCHGNLSLFTLFFGCCRVLFYVALVIFPFCIDLKHRTVLCWNVLLHRTETVLLEVELRRRKTILNVICARMHKDMKTRVMVKHCKSNSYNCDQCEYHRSSVDASVKTQTYKEDQVWHGQGTRKIHELWALVLAGRLYIYEWKKEANFPFRWMPSGRIVARRVVRYHRGHWGIT